MRNPALNWKLTHSPTSPGVSTGLQINTPNSHCSVLGTCSQPRAEGRDLGRGRVSTCFPLCPPTLGAGGALVAAGTISGEWWGDAEVGWGETPLCSDESLKNPKMRSLKNPKLPFPNGESKDQAPAILHPCCSYHVRPTFPFPLLPALRSPIPSLVYGFHHSIFGCSFSPSLGNKAN